MKKKAKVVLAVAAFGLCVLGFMKFKSDIWPQVESSASQMSQSVEDTYNTIKGSGE